ncbi:MAG: hypothetical protein ABEH35_04295 [Haloarculaceae archaeon]
MDGGDGSPGSSTPEGNDPSRPGKYARESIVYGLLIGVFERVRAAMKGLQQRGADARDGLVGAVAPAWRNSTASRIVAAVSAPLDAAARTVGGWILHSRVYRWLTGEGIDTGSGRQGHSREEADAPQQPDDLLSASLVNSAVIVRLVGWAVRLWHWGRSSRAVQQAMRVDEISIRALSAVLVVLLSIRIVATVYMGGTAVQIGLLGLLLVGAVLGYFQPWRDKPV